MSDTYWPCACTRREGDRLAHVKINHITVARCPQCQSERPPMGVYYCSACDKILKRDSVKRWLKSYCDEADRSVRCYLY